MSRLLLATAFLFALAACDRSVETPPAPEPVRGESGQLENGNLLNLVFGAAAIDRDNELSFESSAAHAIDGSDFTPWTSAPGGPLSGVFSLAAPTRLRRLGAALPKTSSTGPVVLRIETSADGQSWARGIEQPVRTDTEAPQLFELSPVVARYVRVTLDSKDFNKGILSLHAAGAEVEPYAQPAIEGCWEINGQPARFMRSGARVTGKIGPMSVDGGTDGRVYRLMWLEPPMWGYAAVSVSPDGQYLSGVRWHEEVNPKHNGDGWFGRRAPCKEDALIGTRTVDTLLDRARVWRLYGVRFDRQDRILAAESAETLDEVARVIAARRERFRIVAREFRSVSVAANRARCAAKLTAMREALSARGVDLTRVEFVSAGTERSALAVDFTSQRAMDSGVDLQAVAR